MFAVGSPVNVTVSTSQETPWEEMTCNVSQVHSNRVVL